MVSDAGRIIAAAPAVSRTIITSQTHQTTQIRTRTQALALKSIPYPGPESRVEPSRTDLPHLSRVVHRARPNRQVHTPCILSFFPSSILLFDADLGNLLLPINNR